MITFLELPKIRWAALNRGSTIEDGLVGLIVWELESQRPSRAWSVSSPQLLVPLKVDGPDGLYSRQARQKESSYVQILRSFQLN